MTPRQLKKLRGEKKLSQFYISKKANVSRYRISQFECSYVNLTKEEKERIKLCFR